MTLYELTEQYKELESLLADGEIDADVFFDTIEGLEGEIDDKIDATCSIIKNKLAEADAIHAESEALAERYRSRKKEAQRISERLASLMLRVGKDKYESPRHAIKFNKGEKVEFTDEDALIEYLIKTHPEIVTEKTEVTVSKTDVKRLIKSGEAIPFTEFSQTMNISIK
jgi:hypothetical protein